MIRFKCPHCGKAIGVKDEGAGKKGKCPACGQTVHVPKARVQEKPEPAETSKPPVHSPAEPKQEILDAPRTQPPQIPAHPQTPLTTGYQPQPVAPMPAPVAVQVNVNQSRAAHSLGIASLVLGILSFFVCWIPFVGFGFGGLGLVLGIAGLVFSIIRKGSGIGYSIAGIAVSSVAVLIGIGFLVVVSGMFSAIDETVRELKTEETEPPPTAIGEAQQPLDVTDATKLDPAMIRRKIDEVEQKIASLENTRHVIVDSASFHWEKDFIEQPVVELAVTNESPHAVKRILFHAILKTPARTLPWVEDDFSYEPAGGLEPGESGRWQLAPNMFGEWRKAPKNRDDMVLSVIVERYETASGEEITVTDNPDKVRELRQQLAELRAKLPPEPSPF